MHVSLSRYNVDAGPNDGSEHQSCILGFHRNAHPTFGTFYCVTLFTTPLEMSQRCSPEKMSLSLSLSLFCCLSFTPVLDHFSKWFIIFKVAFSSFGVISKRFDFCSVSPKAGYSEKLCCISIQMLHSKPST